MFPIEMKHIGKIDAVGTVQVFGYSARKVDRDLHDLIYLNYAGPPTASDAVWAMLIERRALDFTDLRGRPHRLLHGGYPGLEGKEAPFKRFVTRIESLAIDHCILLDRRFFEPTYDYEVGLTFVFEGDNVAQKVGHHVSQCVDIAVFLEWYAGLLALGRRERLVMPLVNFGGHPVYQVTLDRARWTNLIALAVEREELTWPGEEPSEAAKRLLADPIPDPEPEASLAEAPSPRAQIAHALHIRQPLLSVTLPQHLTAQGWYIHAYNGTLQARGPGRSTRIYTLPGSVATEAEIAAICDKIVREIEVSQAEVPTAPEIPPFTLTHEGDWTWLSFKNKPDDWVLHRLKTAGFRWGKRRRAWYARRLVERVDVETLLSRR